MTRSHVWGNHALSACHPQLFGVPFPDSQSGMWIFRRKVLEQLRMRSGGMAFSQELKIEAYRQRLPLCRDADHLLPRAAARRRTAPCVDGFGNLQPADRRPGCGPGPPPSGS